MSAASHGARTSTPPPPAGNLLAKLARLDEQSAGDVAREACRLLAPVSPQHAALAREAPLLRCLESLSPHGGARVSVLALRRVLGTEPALRNLALQGFEEVLLAAETRGRLRLVPLLPAADAEKARAALQHAERGALAYVEPAGSAGAPSSGVRPTNMASARDLIDRLCTHPGGAPCGAIEALDKYLDSVLEARDREPNRSMESRLGLAVWRVIRRFPQLRGAPLSAVRAEFARPRPEADRALRRLVMNGRIVLEPLREPFGFADPSAALRDGLVASYYARPVTREEVAHGTQ